MSRRLDDEARNIANSVDRRAVLGAIGMASLAGCPGLGGDSGGGSDAGGGGSGGGDSTGGGSGGDGAASEPDFCSSLTDGDHARYVEADSPFVATFEHPGGVAATATVNDEHSLTVRVWLPERQPMDVFPSQRLSGTDSPTDAQQGNLNGLTVVDDLDYGGESVPIVRASAGGTGDDVDLYTNYPYFIVGLPHQGSSGTQYYRFDLRATVHSADELETGVCEHTWTNAARRIIDSLEPNPDTTVESEGVE